MARSASETGSRWPSKAPRRTRNSGKLARSRSDFKTSSAELAPCPSKPSPTTPSPPCSSISGSQDASHSKTTTKSGTTTKTNTPPHGKSEGPSSVSEHCGSAPRRRWRHNYSKTPDCRRRSWPPFRARATSAEPSSFRNTCACLPIPPASSSPSTCRPAATPRPSSASSPRAPPSATTPAAAPNGTTPKTRLWTTPRTSLSLRSNCARSSSTLVVLLLLLLLRRRKKVSPFCGGPSAR
mmetsp:Transcript_25040/g.77293  ORF Transcript_25040/g.77293 Transcript_25040/m.77293 type:complete len:238 (-) Transcript_25040:328-1041(-)